MAGDKRGPAAELAAMVDVLNNDELAIVRWVAARLVAGRAQYGPLDLEADPRDFTAEAGEEAVDALIYLSAAALRRRRAPTHPPAAQEPA